MPILHLSARVPWHDSRWNGTVCRMTSCNAFRTTLDRIHEERDNAREDVMAGKPWSSSKPGELPVRKAELGGFMNEARWTHRFVHSHAGVKKLRGRTVNQPDG